LAAELAAGTDTSGWDGIASDTSDTLAILATAVTSATSEVDWFRAVAQQEAYIVPEPEGPHAEFAG
jgi:hypothetical protein